MISTNTIEQLLKDCAILFGESAEFSQAFLDYLQQGGLKSAYRQRVMETHPDRLRVLPEPHRPLQVNTFHEVQAAYERLEQFIKMRDAGEQLIIRLSQGKQSRSTRAPSGKTQSQSSFRYADITRVDEIKPFILKTGGIVHNLGRSQRLYSGPMPERPLLFGNFLYYLGLTNWHTISRILITQRLGRPRLGEMAQQLGILTPAQIDQILATRTRGTRFGEKAIDLGIVRPEQVLRLVARQNFLQKKFGTILREKELVDAKELQELLRLFRFHNRGK